MNEIYLWPAVKLVVFPEIGIFGCYVKFLNIEILFSRFPENIMDMIYPKKKGSTNTPDSLSRFHAPLRARTILYL